MKHRVVRPHCDHDGYLIYSTRTHEKQYCVKIHRLVASAFLINDESKPHVEHLNTKRDDNTLGNLEWVTPKENSGNKLSRLHMSIKAKENFKSRSEEHKMKLSIASSINVKKASLARFKPVEQYSIDGVLLSRFESGVEASKKTGVGVCSISLCARGRYKTGKGFIWKFANQ